MTNEQFKEIKNRAWAWYRGNMLEWAIKTLKDITNAPDWVKDSLPYDLIVCPSMDDEMFALAHKEDIETILRLSQKRNFGVNYTKEILEFQKALRDNNEYEMIDALCDMIVTMCNAGFGFNAKDYAYFINEELNNSSNLGEEFDIFHTHIEDIALHLREKGYEPYECLLETIKELETRTGSWNEEEGKWKKHFGAYSKEELEKELNNKNHIVVQMAETTCDEGDVFIVRTISGVMKIKKWYKADFSKCKVGGENA